MSDDATIAGSTATPGPSHAEASAPNPETGAAPSNASPANVAESGNGQTETPPAGMPPADPNAKPSLTTPKSVASSTQLSNQRGAAPASEGAVDPAAFKRLRDSNSELGRERQRLSGEMESMRREMQALQQFREEQNRKAQEANLKRWDYRHPEHGKFNGLLEKAALIRQQLASVRAPAAPAGLPAEHAEAWRAQFEENAKAAIVGALSPEEQEELQGFQAETQNLTRLQMTNPVAYRDQHIMPHVRQEIDTYFRTKMQEHQAQQEVQRDMSDPDLKPLIAAHREDIAQAMAAGVPYEHAIHYTKVHGAMERLAQENAQLKQQMSAMSGKVSAAATQQQLAKGKASITRDVGQPKPQPFKTALAWARESGIDTDSDAFRAKLRQLEAANN